MSKWQGTKPIACDICHSPIEKEFIDGATVFGPWANMCTECHKESGKGLGVGRGQKYEKQGDDYVKVE